MSRTGYIQSMNPQHPNPSLDVGHLMVSYRFKRGLCDDGLIEMKILRPKPILKPVSLTFADPKQLQMKQNTVCELDLHLINNTEETVRLKVEKLVRENSMVSIHKIILQTPKRSRFPLQAQLAAQDSLFIKLVLFARIKGTESFRFLRFLDLSTGSVLPFHSFQFQVEQ